MHGDNNVYLLSISIKYRLIYFNMFHLLYLCFFSNIAFHKFKNFFELVDVVAVHKKFQINNKSNNSSMQISYLIQTLDS